MAAENGLQGVSHVLRPYAIPTPSSAEYTTSDGKQRSLPRYEYEPLSNAAFRILRLLPRSGGVELADNVFVPRVQIIDNAIDRHEPYEAISYVWGASHDHGLIVVADCANDRHDQHLMVSRSLITALQHLVLDDKPRLLWADQICINQKDLTERASQVAMMSRIFGQAHKTIVWLGASEPLINTAFDFVEFIQQEAMQPAKKLRNERMSVDDVRATKGLLWNAALKHASPEEMEQFAVAIGHMLRNPWFDRLWTFHESIMASILIFTSGTRTCTLTSFRWAFLAVDEAGHKSTMNQRGNRPETIMNTRAQHFKQSIDLFDLLDTMQGMNYKCTDERDRIFALLSTAGPHSALRFDIDYTLPTLEICARLARASMCDLGRLDFLYAVKPCDTVPAPGSWVPTWQNLKWPRRFRVYQAHWDAAKSRKHVEEGATPNMQSIVVRGRRIAQLERVLTSLHEHNGKIDGLNDLLWEATAKIRRPGEELSATVLEQQAQLLDATLSMGHLSRRLRFSQEALLDRIRASYTTGAQDKRDITWRQAQYLIGRRLALLDSEVWSMALLSEQARPGDIICILHGSRVPIVLRPTSDGTYLSLGGCYIEGAMYGEAVTWSEDEGDLFEIV